MSLAEHGRLANPRHRTPNPIERGRARGHSSSLVSLETMTDKTGFKNKQNHVDAGLAALAS